MPARPAISVILTGDAPAAARRRCREAFARQTVRASRFEIVDLPPSGAPVGRRRNRALEAARAPLVLFWDHAWRPLPELLAYCVDQHRRHDTTGSLVLVHAEPGIGTRHSPLARWWLQRGGWPARPATHGVYGWTHVRCPGLSVRADLFAHGRFDEAFAAGDDAELAARLATRLPLTVWFERLVLATVEDVPTIETAVREAYLDGYYRRVRWARTPALREVADLDPVHLEPERFARPEAQHAALWATVHGLEATFHGVELSFLDRDSTDRLQALFDAYEIAVNAATAAGHLAAIAEQPPVLPHVPRASGRGAARRLR